MAKLPWITTSKNINKSCKGLFLGSYTSKKGRDYFYYMSGYNQFYKILSFVLYKREYIESFKNKTTKEINKLLENTPFVKLKKEMRRDDADKEEIRKQIRAELKKYDFEICDLFIDPKFKKENSSLDSDIDISNSKRTNLIKLLDEMPGLEYIFCISKFVKDNITQTDVEFINSRKIRIVCLESPSPSRRLKIYDKIVDWSQKIPNR